MRRIVGLLAVCLLLGAGGCAATQEAKSVEKSGFLGDYSMLKEGQRSTFKESSEDQALWIYKNPAADWRKYTKISVGSSNRLGESERLAAQGRVGRGSAAVSGAALVEAGRILSERLSDDV